MAISGRWGRDFYELGITGFSTEGTCIFFLLLTPIFFFFFFFFSFKLYAIRTKITTYLYIYKSVTLKKIYLWKEERRNHRRGAQLLPTRYRRSGGVRKQAHTPGMRDRFRTGTRGPRSGGRHGGGARAQEAEFGGTTITGR
jgi:hypothetical protein